MRLWDRPCPRGVEAPNRQWALGAFQSEREAWRAPFSACYFVEIHPVLRGGSRRGLHLGKGAAVEVFLGHTGGTSSPVIP